MSLHIHDNCLPLEYATLLKKDLNIPAAITIFPDFGNDSPYLFTPMYEASFKGTKR